MSPPLRLSFEQDDADGIAVDHFNHAVVRGNARHDLTMTRCPVPFAWPNSRPRRRPFRRSRAGRAGRRERCGLAEAGVRLEKKERMACDVDTDAVFKHPVHCFVCEHAFYFPLRKIAEAKKLACPLCGSDINFTDEAYGFVVTSVKETIALIDQSSRDLQRTSIALP
jgi:hypothetical protein